MTRIQRSADCGNSPKNKAAESLAIALEAGEPWPDEGLLDNAVWHRADGAEVSGRDAILAVLPDAPGSIRIEHVTTHGKVGAVTGSSDGKSFAHIFEFTSAGGKQLAAIDSFRKTGKANG